MQIELDVIFQYLKEIEEYAYFLNKTFLEIHGSSNKCGMCYTNTSDNLTSAMGMRNKELSDILVDKIREKLNQNYAPKIDEKDVKYQRIFGDREIDYGNFDVVYYIEEPKELFLIEAKYFSDSLNSSGMVRDDKKLFEKDGYYDRCGRRYDLVFSILNILNATNSCLIVGSMQLTKGI